MSGSGLDRWNGQRDRKWYWPGHWFSLRRIRRNFGSGGMSELRAQIGRIDILVHCAGIIHEKPLLDTSVAEFDRVMAVNLRGSFLVGREAIRSMNGRDGRVIMIASDLAYLGRETFTPFVASKHGVIRLAPSVRLGQAIPHRRRNRSGGSGREQRHWRLGRHVHDTRTRGRSNKGCQ